MKVWYDACTGKHVRYGVAIAKRLRSLGHEVILTTRKHPDTIPLAKKLGEKFILIGKYDPVSPLSRLRESAKRELLFCKLFEDNIPECAISHGSVELCRVAFGFNIPIISTADSPHATAANKLALPLVDAVVFSKAIPRRIYEKYGAKKLIQFDGVDEVAWIKDYKPEKVEYEKPLIVVRQMEMMASYAKGKMDITERLAQKLTSFGNVVFLTRYDRRPRKGLIVPRTFVDSASLTAHADLVVSIGGTIAREAALQGTPSMVISTMKRLYTNEYISKRGFPLFTVDPSGVINHAKKCIELKINVKELIAKLEDPVDIIERMMRKQDVRESGD